MPTCLAIGATTVPADPSGRSVPDGRHRAVVFYEDVVRPTCEQLGLTLLRADALTEAGLPADQLLRLLTEVDIVVADLSGSDEELSFGLGMRHALGRCTVHVTEGSITHSRAVRTPSIELASHPDGALTARQQLTTLLVDAFRGAAAAAEPSQPMAQTHAELAPGQDDQPGLFDLAAEAEAQLEAISGDMADVESALTDLGAMMELIAEDMVRVSHPGASMTSKLAVINRLAKAIDGPVGDLEAAAERFAERMGAGVGAFGAFLEWAADTPRGEWPDGTAEVLDQVATASPEMQTMTIGFQEVMALINLFGASSRHLRGPARRIGKSLQTMFRSVAVLEEWQGKAEAIRRA
ncbi:hypothetical protein PV416_06605 [Streptomyces ipomoeae]|uniref:Uncharacterized protein n=2 Tax=Streptomyces ipomoeae 91-03 TaxID=698759 RepID=L1L3B0_9ACTN|nr:hypothetical protein [Streptomyces ipomoeae]EKX67556.1 hypothetical protein STRIP9103_00986 [Streptomyces ipomoeae 91-03]MDX2692641.1 hypothetical protein [Streptomyces ipomoeae]MDX2820767.1 hypothetical protein [Streptomyces ipomoeae]MDX2837566.1 hypothetical protein [Streptomyces ipomoeae]